MDEMDEMAKRTGHSTTPMAARYARGIGAKKLILTHLSSRYPACSARFEPPEIQEMRQLAVSYYGSENVCIAEDLMRISIWYVCSYSQLT